MKINRCRASALLFALCFMVILAMLGSVALEMAVAKYQNTFQTTGWQESLMLSESGIDLGLAEVRKTIPGNTFSPWQQPAWTSGTANGIAFYSCSTSISIPAPGGTTPVGTVQVHVDAPPALVDTNGNQCYRIRATGTQFIGGPPRTTGEKADSILRQLALRTNRFTNAVVTTPQASRTIEVIARPDFNNSAAAILSVGSIWVTMSGNTLIDSYNSTDPTKSTNGQYDPAKSQSHGNVDSNASNMTLSGNVTIKGNVGLNGGNPTTTGNAVVLGSLNPNFYAVVAPVTAPSWISTPDQNLGSINHSTTIATNPSGVLHVNAGSISLSGQNTVTITRTTSTTYLDLYVNGNISESGQARFIVDPNVVVTVWVTGNVNLSGQGIVNNSASYNRPANFVINGISSPAPGSPPSYSLSGNGNLSAVINAPGADITMSGGGNSGGFYGSIIGKTFTLSGGANFHYDESLGGINGLKDYVVCSWFEDTLLNCNQ